MIGNYSLGLGREGQAFEDVGPGGALVPTGLTPGGGYALPKDFGIPGVRELQEMVTTPDPITGVRKFDFFKVGMVGLAVLGALAIFGVSVFGKSKKRSVRPLLKKNPRRRRRSRRSRRSKK